MPSVDTRRDIGISDAGARRSSAPQRGRWPAAPFSLFLGLTLIICMVLDLSFPGRTLLAVAFVLTVPGVTVADHLQLPHQCARWSVAVALSISCHVLAAQVMLFAHSWHPLASAVVLTALAVIAWVFGSRSTERSRRWKPIPKTGHPKVSSTNAVTPLLLVGGILCWIISVKRISLAHMNGYGLLSAINWEFPAALLFASAAAGWELTRRRIREPWLVLTTVLFVIFLFGYQAAIEGPARIPVGWLHVGFADYINAHGEVLHGYDARFYWPGFFAAVATLTTFAGLDSALPLLRWAPLLYNLLALLPLVWLARSAASSRRIAWLAVPLFYVGNWIDQDYLSPQATVYLLYLTLIASLFWLAQVDRVSGAGGTDVTSGSLLGERHVSARAVWGMRLVGAGILVLALVMVPVVAAQVAPLPTIWSRVPHEAVAYSGYAALVTALFVLARSRPSAGRAGAPGRRSRLLAHVWRAPPPVPGLIPRQALALGGVMTLIIMSTVVSHQLTPITMILAMMVFAVSGRLRYKELVPITALMVTGWFTFAAVEFWQGNSALVFGDVGKVGFSVKAGVEEHVVGDVQHLRIQYLRLGLSAAFLIAAALGGLLRRQSLSGRLLVGLALSPFLLVLVQSYGGEVILRVILFGMPALSLLAAELLARARPRSIALTKVAVAVLLALGGLALIGARGGNEPFVRVAGGEYAAMQTLFNTAPEGTKIAGVLGEASPLGYRDVGGHDLMELDGCQPGLTSLQCALRLKPDYIFVSLAQEEYGHLVQGRPIGWSSALVTSLDASGQYRTMYRNSDATVLKRVS